MGIERVYLRKFMQGNTKNTIFASRNLVIPKKYQPMKRIYCTLLLCVAFPFFAGAEKLIQTFKDVPLTEALLGIERQQETYRIHFVYNDLENYRVTTRIHQLRTRDAVLAVCENLPVKVWGKGKDIFVESLERSKEENTKTAPTNPLAPEKTKELKEIDVNASMVVCVPKAGTLSTILTQEQRDTLTSLSLSGKLNSADIRTLRHMAGYKEEEYNTGRLKWLDLREVEFVTDSKPYLVLDATEEKMMGFAKGKFYDQSGGPRYWPYYVLNSPPNEDSLAVGRVNLLAKDWTDKQTGISLANSPFMSSSKVSFDFRIQFTKVDRMWMHRYEMKKFEGHRMKWTGVRYEYIACTYKGIFFLDMFYKCPQMKTIVLPEHTRISENVSVYGDPISYARIETKTEE